MKKRINLVIITLLIIVFSSISIKTYAKDLTGVIKGINESESEVTFSFSFDQLQLYDITLTDPNGEVINVVEESSEINVKTSHTYKGDYSYKIKAKDEDVTFIIKVISSGKVIASVDSSKPIISENVSNLKLFFEDGDLVASWSYDGVVSITITDPARFNNLVSNETVGENYYRLKIPDNVDRIQFYICPVTDVKINGAGLTYTRDVKRSVDALVTFPEKRVVNKDSIPIKLSVNEEDLLVKIYSNSYIVNESNHEDLSITPFYEEYVDLGTYEVEIPLSVVDNNIVVCIVDKLGNGYTYSYQYIRDLQAPKIDTSKLSIDNSGIYQNYQTVNDVITISGSVTDEVSSDVLGSVESLYINGYPVSIDSSGRFSFEEKINLGDNNVEIVAIDESGNEARLDFNVTMVENVPSKAPKKVLIFISLIFLLLLSILVYITIKGRDKENKVTKKIFRLTKESKKELKMEEKKPSNQSKLLESSMFMELFDDERVDEIEYEDDCEDNQVLLSEDAVIEGKIEPKDAPTDYVEKITFSNPKSKEGMVPILSVIDNEDFEPEKKKLLFQKNSKTKDRKLEEDSILNEPKDKNENTKKPKVTSALLRKKEEKIVSKALTNEKVLKTNPFKELGIKISKVIPKTEKKEKPKKVVDEKKNRYLQINYIVSISTCVVLVCILIFFFKKVISNTVIMSGSMEPTLKVGQVVIYNQLAYKNSSPERGDIISFTDESSGMNLSKRVIGISGDLISFKDGYVIINGTKANELSYLDSDVETICSKEFLVPEGCVFVLGDNRENSLDSRFFEEPYVKIEAINGKYFGSFPKFW